MSLSWKIVLYNTNHKRGCFIVTGFRVDLDCSLEVVYVIEGIRNGRIYSIATDKTEWERLTIKEGLCY